MYELRSYLGDARIGRSPAQPLQQSNRLTSEISNIHEGTWRDQKWSLILPM